MKKSILSILMIFLVISTILICRSNEQLGHAKVSYYAKNMDSLINDSQVIVEAIATNSQESIKYGGAKFIKTKVKIKDVLKGEVDNKNEIIILQSMVEEDPSIKKASHIVLFLEKYSGPIIDNAYVCKGLYQGHLVIDDSGKLKPSLVKSGEQSYNRNKKLQTEIEEYDIKKLAEKIKEKDMK